MRRNRITVSMFYYAFPIAIALAVVVIIGGWFFYSRPTKPIDVGIVGETTPVGGLDALLQSGNSTELFDYVKNLEIPAGYPEQLANLKAQLVIGDRIIQLESDSQGPFLHAAELMKIDTVMEFNRLHENFGLSLDFVNAQLDRHVVSKLASPSVRVAHAANLCTSATRYHQYLSSRNDNDFEAMREQFRDTANLLVESEAGIRLLVKFLIKFDAVTNNKDRDHQVMREMAKIIGASPNETIQLIGADMLDYSFVAEQDLPKMTLGISLADAGDVQHGLDFIENVARENRFGNRTYGAAILIAEQIERTSDSPRLQTAITQLINSVSDVSNALSKRKIEETVADFAKRRQLPGKPFDLVFSETAESKSSSYQFGGKRVVLLFYDDSGESTLALDFLGSCGHLTQPDSDVSFLAVELESIGPPANEHSRTIRAEQLDQYSHIIRVKPEQSTRFLEQCPVQRGPFPFPFLILIGNDGTVIESNVNPEKLRILLEKTGVDSPTSTGQNK